MKELFRFYLRNKELYIETVKGIISAIVLFIVILIFDYKFHYIYKLFKQFNLNLEDYINFLNFISNNIPRLNVIHTYFNEIILRVVPIMIPVVLGLSSFMLNKYTDSHFTLIYKSSRITNLFKHYLYFIIYHLLFITLTENTVTNKYLLVSITDILLAIWILLYSIHTGIKLYIYSQPNKLSKVLEERISTITNQLLNEVFYISDSKKELKKLLNDLSYNISLYINITILAIISKDQNLTNVNLEKISKMIWNELIDQVTEKKSPFQNFLYICIKALSKFKGNIMKSYKKQVNKYPSRKLNFFQKKITLVKADTYFYLLNKADITIKKIGKKRDDYIDQTILKSNYVATTTIGYISNFYQNVYKSAFENKEYYVSQQILVIIKK